MIEEHISGSMQAMAHDWHRRRHSQRDVEFKLSTSRSGNCTVQYVVVGGRRADVPFDLLSVACAVIPWREKPERFSASVRSIMSCGQETPRGLDAGGQPFSSRLEQGMHARSEAGWVTATWGAPSVTSAQGKH